MHNVIIEYLHYGSIFIFLTELFFKNYYLYSITLLLLGIIIFRFFKTQNTIEGNPLKTNINNIKNDITCIVGNYLLFLMVPFIIIYYNIFMSNVDHNDLFNETFPIIETFLKMSCCATTYWFLLNETLNNQQKYNFIKKYIICSLDIIIIFLIIGALPIRLISYKHILFSLQFIFIQYKIGGFSLNSQNHIENICMKLVITILCICLFCIVLEIYNVL